jgi:hypothetical protein
MGAILTGVGIGAPIASGISQRRAIKLESDAVASAAEYNAAIVIQEGAQEAARRRRLARRELSSQRVAFAKAGVRLEGSPLELLAQNAAELELDAVNVEIAARNTANLERTRAKNIKDISRTSQGAALLSGATTAAFRGASLLRKT